MKGGHEGRLLQFDWRRVVRKEYGSTFAGLLTMMALLVWEDFARLRQD